MTNPFQEYQKCFYAYRDAGKLLSQDKFNPEQAKQLHKTLTADNTGLKILEIEEGQELERLVSELERRIQQEPPVHGILFGDHKILKYFDLENQQTYFLAQADNPILAILT